MIVPIYQTDVRAADLGLHTRFSPTLSLLADTIRLARRDGLEVTVFPILRLRSARPGEWRGNLAPANPGEWFQRYADLLGDLAAVANLTGASRFVVGSELSSLDGDLDRWRPLLERIRGVFKGSLIYSANWDHFREAKLLDLVDEDGVTGYFNLRADARAPSDAAALEEGWRRVKQELDTWHAGRRRPAGLHRARLSLARRLHRLALGRGRGCGDRFSTSSGAPSRPSGASGRAFSLLDGVYVWNWSRFRWPHQHQLHAARQTGRGRGQAAAARPLNSSDNRSRIRHDAPRDQPEPESPDSRARARRRDARLEGRKILAAAVLAVGAVICAELAAARLSLPFDPTEDRVYTLSPASRDSSGAARSGHHQGLPVARPAAELESVAATRVSCWRSIAWPRAGSCATRSRIRRPIPAPRSRPARSHRQARLPDQEQRQAGRRRL